MNKYFIQLFLEENTVIIPELGALTVTNETTKEIMFLPYLKFNDGKLIDFICKTEGIDSVSATNMISKFVREINAKLDQGDSYDIFEFGSFYKNAAGEIEFHADKSNAGQVVKEEENEIQEVKATEISEDVEVRNDTSIIETTTEDTFVADDAIEEEEEMGMSFELSQSEPIEEKISSAEFLFSILNQNKEASQLEKEGVSEVPKAEDEIHSEDSDAVSEEHAPVEIALEEVEQPIEENSISDVFTSHNIDEVEKSESKEELNMDSSLPVEASLSQGADSVEKPAEIFEENTLIDIPKKTKKRKLSFAVVFLWLICLSFAGAGVWAYFNFDKVKPHLPFLSESSEQISNSKEQEDEHIKVMRELSGMAEEEEVSESKEQESGIVEESSVNGESKNDSEPAKKVEAKKAEVKSPEPKKKVEKPVSISKPQVSKAKSTTTTQIVGNSNGGNNYIIIGSFSAAQNAEKLASKLKSKGFDASTIPSGPMTMVSAGSFATVQEAQVFLAQNKSVLGDGWVFKK